MQRAILMAIEEVNAAGGAGGRRLEALPRTRRPSRCGGAGAKKLIDVNKVQAILGTWSSGVTLAVMPLTDEANLIQMNVSGAPAISTQDRRTSSGATRPPTTASARRSPRSPPSAATSGRRRWRSTTPPHRNTEGFRKAWEKRGGKVVASVVYEPNRPSYRSELQKVLAEKPDVIVTGSYLPDTTIIIREWFQSGDKNAWIIPAGRQTPTWSRRWARRPARG